MSAASSRTVRGATGAEKSSPAATSTSHQNQQRCGWVGSDPLMVAYHDSEWGVPVHDDQKLFEFMVLDAMQAGLSFRIILQKRGNFKQALDGFDPVKIAKYRDKDLDRLVRTEGIIRNHQKLAATIANAQAALEIQQEFGSLDSYLWQFVGGRPKVNAWKRTSQIPAISPEAESMSSDLKGRGFKFVGPTICYAFMQAAGLVNDHLTTCFRYAELANTGKRRSRSKAS
jgi:DNA-3-methyladenine glycosylase I